MDLKGAITALITPFNNDGSIDEQCLRDFVESQIEAGISGLLPMGTTGESPTVNNDEHIKIIEIVVDQSNKRVPVIAGTGSNCTQEAIDMTAHAKSIGADISLQVAPYYNKPSQEGFYRHFMEIADNVSMPHIIYNIPGRTGKNIENSTMLKLAQHKNIIAVKEASGDICQMMDLIANKPEDFIVFSGDDNLALPLTLLGGMGVISVASNIIPKEMGDMIKAALENDVKKAKDLHYKYLPLFKALFIDTNPIPIKYMLSQQNILKEVYRLPMCEMSDESKNKVFEVMEDLALL